MAPTYQQILLSPAELSYIHTSLALNPPIRPDSRSPTQFRPLVAESDILPGTNGSARICFADGTEAVVGIKAEVEKSGKSYYSSATRDLAAEEDEADRKRAQDDGAEGQNEWLDLTVEIPGTRDDDLLPVFLSSMLSEALLADGEFTKRLWINRRFHWKLCIDILLLSPPLSYPLPLLSLTTHLALLSTRLPMLKSEKDEDPLFDDDWDASRFLYPRTVRLDTETKQTRSRAQVRPPITLLVISVGDNVIFDPSMEELGVAETVLAVSVSEQEARPTAAESDAMDIDVPSRTALRLLAIRTIDPPSRLTAPGVPNSLNTATGGSSEAAGVGEPQQDETNGVWRARRGGATRKIVREMIRRVLEKGGPAEEVLDGLDTVEVG